MTRQLIVTQAHHTVPFVLLATVTCQLAHDNCPVLSRKLLTVAPSYQFPVTCDQAGKEELTAGLLIVLSGEAVDSFIRTTFLAGDASY